MLHTEPARIISDFGVLLFNPGRGLPGLHLTGLPGLDSPDIRTPISNRPQAHGAIHHVQFFGARTFTIEGVILQNTTTDLQLSENALKGHWYASVADSRLPNARFAFTPKGESERFVTFKPSDELTISGTHVKEFQMPVVAVDPTIYTMTQFTSGGGTLVNAGDAPSWPVFKVYGGSVTITNSAYSPSRSIVMSGAPAGGGYVEINPFTGTAYLNGDGANMAPYIDWSATSFWPLMPGSNPVSVSGASTDILWNHGWV